MEKKDTADTPPSDLQESGDDIAVGELINAGGHVQELSRNFSLLSLAGVGLTVGNVWPAAGGSILVALYNGGPPGVLYEFVVVSVFYWCVAACIAELASAIPSSAGVYHWATVTPGAKWGRVVGFFAGFWNWLAWVFGAASMSLIFVCGSINSHADVRLLTCRSPTPLSRCMLSSMKVSQHSHGMSS
jgi:choline transport protein